MKAFYLYAESQIHAGTGTELGIVDLPIQRERTTGIPIIQGIKGALRSSGILEDRIFGSKPNVGDSTEAGEFAFSEAKLLLFPVRSVDRTFVWVTCPLILGRFFRALQKDIAVPSLKTDDALIADDLVESAIPLSIEELEKPVWFNENLQQIARLLSGCAPDEYIKAKLQKDVVMLDDNTFSSVVKTMTEVVPRIRIDNKTGTVRKGSLWYEEYLPQDTVLYFVARATYYSKASEEKLSALDNKMMSIGGKETVGKGFVLVKEVS